jgi:hypothetical protein
MGEASSFDTFMWARHILQTLSFDTDAFAANDTYALPLPNHTMVYLIQTPDEPRVYETSKKDKLEKNERPLTPNSRKYILPLIGVPLPSKASPMVFRADTSSQTVVLEAACAIPAGQVLTRTYKQPDLEVDDKNDQPSEIDMMIAYEMRSQ